MKEPALEWDWEDDDELEVMEFGNPNAVASIGNHVHSSMDVTMSSLEHELDLLEKRLRQVQAQMSRYDPYIIEEML